MITYSAGDIEDYALLHHAPSISVHFCQPGNPNKPWSLWKHKSKFASETFVPGSIRARKITDTFYLVAFACMNFDGTVNEEIARTGLITIFKRAAELESMVYFQHRSKSFPTDLMGFIRGYAGAVCCFLSKVDNGANND